MPLRLILPAGRATCQQWQPETQKQAGRGLRLPCNNSIASALTGRRPLRLCSSTVHYCDYWHQPDRVLEEFASCGPMSIASSLGYRTYGPDQRLDNMLKDRSLIDSEHQF